jgi:hypothetical protein
MTAYIRSFFFFASFSLLASSAWAQNTVMLSGYVRDSASGERLNQAQVRVESEAQNTSVQSNNYGFYSLRLAAGTYTIKATAIGHKAQVFELNLSADQSLNIDLAPQAEAMQEIYIGASRSANTRGLNMSTQTINGQTIKKIPALLGEADVVRSIQMLPGVSTVGEGATGFNVRGGGIDQNLILMDEAPVFNSAHLFGFFSIFNPDAVKDVQLIKGGIPAAYGGRLSSTLDVIMRDGNEKEFKSSGGVGTIFSRFAVEGPLMKERPLAKDSTKTESASFIVAGRRSYIDFLAKPFLPESLAGSQFFFYDFTAKANYARGNDRFYLSTYLGDDVFNAVDAFGFKWGNSTATARWNHVFNPRLFSNTTYYYSRYRYNFIFDVGGNRFDWQSYIVNNSVKSDFRLYANSKNEVSFGGQMTYYRFIPGEAEANNISGRTVFGLPDRFGLENALYLSDDINANGKFSVRAGLRVSQFLYLGPGKVYTYYPAWEVGQRRFVESITESKKGEVVAQYINPEPRLGLKYELSKSSSLKAGYNRMAQYLHLISNTAASVPLDVWQPSTNNIKPQLADQVTLGYFKNLVLPLKSKPDAALETSLEGFYKTLQNQVDYIDGASLLLNEFLEGELLTGIGRAYGLEAYVRKNSGAFTGWVSYPLSRSERQVAGINNGDWYPNRFDRKHNLNIITQYRLNPEWDFAANWAFSSGTPTTFYSGQYTVQGYLVPDAGSKSRNNVRNPNYHRLDLSATWTRRKSDKWERSWVFSVYNAYNRRNPFSIYFDTNYKDLGQNAAIRYSIIGSFVPAVSYNFTWN